MTFTKRISIERYKGELAEQCAGLIEGETEDGESWIIYMDAQGRPEIYWPKREEDGAVVGKGIRLKTLEGLPDHLRDLCDDLKPCPGEEILAIFPIWKDGMRAILFAVEPDRLARTDIDPRENQDWLKVDRVIKRLYANRILGEGEMADEGWKEFDEPSSEKS